MCACRRPLEATQTVPKALPEPAVAFDHQADPPDPLGAVPGRSELPDGRHARMSVVPLAAAGTRRSLRERELERSAGGL